MFSAISNWFSTQTNKLDKAHANISWEEALDNAIYKISLLKSVESDTGKDKLALILDELKLIQFSTQAMLNEIQHDDNLMSAAADSEN